MIERYSRPEIAALFSDQTKFSNWLKVEILAVEARAIAGAVPAEDLEEIKARASFDIARIHELEAKTRHDVAAFVDNVAETVGAAGRHLHYGMTSSDVLDTALSLQLRQAGNLLVEGAGKTIAATVSLARQHAGTVMAGRTHGIHAEPISFGHKAAGWALELDRGRTRLKAAIRNVSVGKLSGAVGTFSQLPPEVEEYVCEKLGLEPETAATQVVSRDRHSEFVYALAGLAATIDRIATEIRHLARTEVGEAEEPFAAGEQKGSSAMPHKRNPWRCERLSGLARIVRAAVIPALENVVLWHERDISHSSVERVSLPDACLALDFMLAEAEEILSGLVVYPDRMRRNMDVSHGVLFSQNILLALIDKGMTRDEAYRIVQEAAQRAAASDTHLRELMPGIPEISSRLNPDEIEKCFDESRYLAHAKQIVNSLEGLA
ncbi:MAG: adenylosuccinate lyase [Actinomycetota bacterium]